MRAILHLLFGLALAVAAASADTLTPLHKSFMERYDAANLSRDEQLKKLDASYLAALNRQVEKAKATGKLDTVIPFLDEVQAVKNAADALPELPATASLELKQMRAKHAEARAKILKSHAEAVTALADKMTTALKAQESELTKAGKIDQALAAKHMRESLEKDEGVSTARKQIDQLENRKSGTPSLKWISLAAIPHEITKSGQYYVGLWDAEKGKGERYKPFMDFFETQTPGKKRDDLIIMIPPAEITFKTPSPVVEFQGKAVLGFGGDVTFRIKAGGQTVQEHHVKGGDTEPKEILCKFPPTRNITLEVDPNGDVTADCSAWLEALVR